ncbi:MAG: hypothetical protein AB7R55_11285 [Gemmatimonadales bacterium]
MTAARLTLALMAGALWATGSATAQNPRPGSGAGGLASRFIPLDVLVRMQERPSEIEAAVMVPGSIDSAWVALEATLDQLGVPVAFRDREAGEIGTPQAKLFRRLGKERLSTYLRCGSGMTGPNADSYAVYLSLVVFVDEVAGGEVAIRPYIAAFAVDVAGGRNDPLPCTTTGRLEKRIGNEVKLKVLKLG